RLRRHRRRPAPAGAADADDLLGGGVQLRRGAAGVRVPGHAGADRPGDRAPGQLRGVQDLRGRLQPPQLLGPHAHLHVLPDPAHGADHGAGHRRPQARVAGGLGQPGGQRLGVLALHRSPRPVATAAGRLAPALRQRLRRGRHRLRADRQLAEHHHHRPLRPDPRGRAPQPEPRLRAGAGDDPHHRALERRLHLAAGPQRAAAPVKPNRLVAWVVIGLGVLYFFVPLLGTFEFSLRYRRGVYSFEAYRIVLNDPVFRATFGYSTVLAFATIIAGVLLVVP